MAPKEQVLIPEAVHSQVGPTQFHVNAGNPQTVLVQFVCSTGEWEVVGKALTVNLRVKPDSTGIWQDRGTDYWDNNPISQNKDGSRTPIDSIPWDGTAMTVEATVTSRVDTGDRKNLGALLAFSWGLKMITN